MWTLLWNTLLIFFLRVTDVSLGTVRTILIMRGMRLWAAAVGFVEITIWVYAIGKVVGQLTHPVYVLGYSSGFAAGTLTGMWIVEKLSLGNVTVRMVSPKKGHEIARAIREDGYGATLIQASGQSGTVYLVDVVTARRRLPAILKRARSLDERVFITVEDAPHVMGGYQRLFK